MDLTEVKIVVNGKEFFTIMDTALRSQYLVELMKLSDYDGGY